VKERQVNQAHEQCEVRHLCMHSTSHDGDEHLDDRSLICRP